MYTLCPNSHTSPFIIELHISLILFGRFMFGVPAGVLESMYGGAENIPITGLISGMLDLLQFFL